jgi:hypothetical protein
LTAACAVSTLACSSVIQAHRPASAAEAQEMASDLNGIDVEVAVDSGHGGESLRGRVIALDMKRILLATSPGSGTPVPFETTRKITFNDRGHSGGVGFLIGAVPGVIGGFVLGKLLGNCMAFQGDENMPPCQDHSTAVGVDAAIVTGLLTGLIGWAIGRGVGHPTTIMF